MPQDKKMVTLESKQLGKREFTEAHAAKLLAIQKKLKTDDWQPVAAEPIANKDNTVKNETNGAADTGDSQSS